MTRRRLLLIALLLLGGGVAYWAIAAQPNPGVTRENFRRLHRHMTRAQVESILGKGDSTRVIEYWAEGDIQVAIAFFENGEAASGTFFEPSKKDIYLRESPEGISENLRYWIYKQTGW